MKRFAAAAVLLLAGCAPPGTVVVEDGDSAPLPPMPSRSSAPSPTKEPSPTTEPACTAGARIERGEREAAAGLRVVGFDLINCGRTPYRLNGYPVVRALDEARRPLDVRVLQGTTEITGQGTLPNGSGTPRPVVLGPGERATTVIAWRNTYDDISAPPVRIPALEITPAAGAPALVVTLEDAMDLGSTGRFGVSPWLGR